MTKQPIFEVDGLKTNLLGIHAISALNLAVRLDTTSCQGLSCFVKIDPKSRQSRQEVIIS